MLSFVLLTYSLHTNHNEYFNNQNFGIGLETVSNIFITDLTYGAYVYKNSYNDDSLMLSISKQENYYGYGLAIANGYSKNPEAIDKEYMISPELTLKYKNLRLKTSYPFGTISNGYDVINLQITFDIK